MNDIKLTKHTSGEIIAALSQNAKAVSIKTLGEHSDAFCVGRYEALIAQLCTSLPMVRHEVEDFLNRG